MKRNDWVTIEGKPLPTPRRPVEDVLTEARERASFARNEWAGNHAAADQDVRFIEGEQWPASIVAERQINGQPCLTLNNLPVFIEQVTGEARQSRPAIHVKPTDGYAASKPFVVNGDNGKPSQMPAHEVLEGIIRAIEFNSSADAHYDGAIQHAAEGGFGWLRVLTRYASAKDFDQELIIRRVKNRWSVLMDPLAEEPDFSDARYALVSQKMPRAEFLRRWPDAKIGALDIPEHREYWGDGQEWVQVAEYFTREAVERELLLLENGQTTYLDQVEGIMQGEAIPGPDGAPIPVVRRRKVVAWRVIWRLITAWDVLVGPLELPFTTIPLVPVLGRERNLRDGTTTYSGLVRHVQDAQRMDNYWMSAATERVALTPKAPWVGPVEAFEGFEAEWRDANTRNASYLPYNGDAPAPPVQAAPAVMPTAELQISASMVDRKKAIIGIFDSALGAQSNETSARAIFARKSQSNTVNFVFPDNLNRAIRRIGILLVEAIPRIYDSERVMRLLGEDGKGTWLTVNQIVTDPETGQETVINSLGDGDFDVAVQPGPSYQTMREEAGEAMVEMVRVSPDMAPLIGDKMVEAMNWPGARQISERLRRNIAAQMPHVLSPEEAAELQQEQQAGQELDPQTGQPAPSPEEQAAAQQQQMAQAAMQMQMQVAQAETEAKMAQAEADKATAAAQMKTAEATAAMAQAKMAEAQAKIAALANPAPMRDDKSSQEMQQ